jgi:hypothetical protein
MEFRWQMIRLEAMTLSFYQRFVENAIVYGLSDGKEDNQ